MNILRVTALYTLFVVGLGLNSIGHCEEVRLGEDGLPITAEDIEAGYIASGHGRIDAFSLSEKYIVVDDGYMNLADKVKYVDTKGVIIPSSRFQQGVKVSWEADKGKVVVLSYLAGAVAEVDAPASKVQTDKAENESYDIRLEDGVYRN